MTDFRDPNKAVDFIIQNAPKFAAARAHRVYLEEYRKSKKAILMGQSEEKSAVAREQFAYAHAQMLELIEGLRVAVEEEETLRWQLVAAQARVEIWRTQEASNRAQDRSTR